MCSAALWKLTAYPRDLTSVSSEVLVLSWIYHHETAEVLWVGAKPGSPREHRKEGGVLARAGSSLLEQGGGRSQEAARVLSCACCLLALLLPISSPKGDLVPGHDVSHEIIKLSQQGLQHVLIIQDHSGFRSSW